MCPSCWVLGEAGLLELEVFLELGAAVHWLISLLQILYSADGMSNRLVKLGSSCQFLGPQQR